MKPQISNFLICALLFVIFLVIFNFTLTMMAGPYIAGSLGASNDIATYTTIFFAFGNAIGLPLSRILSLRMGTVPLLCACLLLFAILSYSSAQCESYAAIVASRFLEGFAAGPVFPVVVRILFSLTPPEKKQTLSSSIILISALAPVFGASYGGWISYDYHWTWVFYGNLPLMLVLSVLFYFTLKDKKIEIPDIAFNPIGYLSYASWVLCLGSAIALGQFLDWQRSNIILSLFAFGGFSFLFYLLWDLRHPHPIIHLHLFKKFSFSMAMISLGLLFSAYFGMVLLLGLWLTLDVNYTPIWFAVILGTMGIAGLILGLFMSKFQQMDPRIPLGIAVVFFAISCFFTTDFSVDIDFRRIAFSRILAGFGLAFFLQPIFRLSSEGLSYEESNDAMVIFQMVRSLASGLGASIYTTMWWRRTIFYHERLGEQITAFSEETQMFFHKAAFWHIHGKRASAELNYFLNRQAKALALDDCFYFMAWICVILLTLILLTTFRKEPLLKASPLSL